MPMHNCDREPHSFRFGIYYTCFPLLKTLCYKTFDPHYSQDPCSVCLIGNCHKARLWSRIWLCFEHFQHAWQVWAHTNTTSCDYCCILTPKCEVLAPGSISSFIFSQDQTFNYNSSVMLYKISFEFWDNISMQVKMACQWAIGI